MTRASDFTRARDLLIAHREDYAAARREFQWPRPAEFNWALDYFDAMAAGNARAALHIVDEPGGETRLSFDDLRARSNRVANYLRALGLRRGDRVVMMLGNVAPLWEITLGAMKLGVVVSPATALLTTEDLQDRVDRGEARCVFTDVAGTAKFAEVRGDFARVVIGGEVAGWRSWEDAYAAPDAFTPEGITRADDPLLLYFTSGTTAKPKMVLHTHVSYPIGHLSTMYWLGLREGDVHLNISSPGWAKHAWSNLFAPWNAGATVFIHNGGRFDPRRTLDTLVRYGITTLCAPPTVWRSLILEDMKAYEVVLREAISAGEPLNPEVIERVRAMWGLTIRDGYGQTETTAQIGNSPGQPVKPGSMGRPLPGYEVTLRDLDGNETDHGEIALSLRPPAISIMAGYLDSPERTKAALGGEFYRTSDVARRDEDGYYWYVGRADDVFKSSDYLVSPFELESALIECDCVAEAAVVPSPDAKRLCVPKAFVMLRPGLLPTRETALTIFRFIKGRLAPFRRVRRIEFYDLPKTISGKIRRVQLRALEDAHEGQAVRREGEFWEEDFPELK